jgi:protein-L-isoaspartate(D-aspartate) O-methyltransferase
MVKYQIEMRGISDPKVLDAMRRVPRHKFIPEYFIDSAYEDGPLPVGEGQTISQPYMVALMTEVLKLKKEDKVLEIGTGSGYQAAILAELCNEVYSIERIQSLAENARAILKELGYTNVFVFVGDGTLGLKEYAPFDKIIVTAAAPKVPPTLIRQLNVDGRIVIPIGDRFSQDLYVIEKKDTKLKQKFICGCVFVPLIGAEGWKI